MPRIGHKCFMQSKYDAALNRQDASWDVVIRKLDGIDRVERTAIVVFHFRSRRAPHFALRAGLEFELARTDSPDFTGTIGRVSMLDVNTDPNSWRDPLQTG